MFFVHVLSCVVFEGIFVLCWTSQNMLYHCVRVSLCGRKTWYRNKWYKREVHNLSPGPNQFLNRLPWSILMLASNLYQVFLEVSFKILKALLSFSILSSGPTHLKILVLIIPTITDVVQMIKPLSKYIIVQNRDELNNNISNIYWEGSVT